MLRSVFSHYHGNYSYKILLVTGDMKLLYIMS